jgi:hypothetical protein
MGREGFEPPKRFRSGFTARPIWPLWNLPGIRLILDVFDRPVRASLRREDIRSSDSPLNRRFRASEGIRTPDPLITNQPLYLLSYAGAPSPVQKKSFLVRGSAEEEIKNKKNSPRARSCSFSEG